MKTRSRMICHWFRHHAGLNCIPVLTSCSQCWTDDMTRQTAEQLQISAMSVQRAQKKALEALRQQLAEAG